MPAASAMSRTVVLRKPLLGEQPRGDREQLTAPVSGRLPVGSALMQAHAGCSTATTSPVMYDA